MVNKKGFTLIELLAVIVILAIIALIATPIILGIVEDARKDSFMRSVELVIKTTDIDIFSKNYTNTYTYTITDGNIPNLEVGVKNTDGMNGSIIYDTKGLEQYAIHNGKYCVIKEEGMKKAEIKDYVEGECELVIPTDASYFTYVDILRDFRIVDVDACVNYYVNMYGYYYETNAISICNNEPQDMWNELSLTEYANEYPTDDFPIVGLIEAEALDGVPTGDILLTGYNEEGSKDVIIPSVINGKQVIVIGEESFSNLDLTSIAIPKTVTGINYGAFSDNLLQEVTIPSNVEYISGAAFVRNLLQEVTISDGVKSIGGSAFVDNSLQTITIPSSVEYIGGYAFEFNSLQNVIIENDDIEIDGYAFCGNPFAENVNSESYKTIYDINPYALDCPPQQTPM